MDQSKTDFSDLALFLAIAFGWTWFFWVPVALLDSGVADIPAEFLNLIADGQPAAWGPLIGAIIVAIKRSGFAGLKALGSSMIRVRFSVWYYLAAIALLPFLVGIAQLIAIVAGDEIPISPALENPISIPIAFIFIFFLGGPLQEEAGWRGTSTQILQGRFGALIASLVSGGIWGLWHLPLFFQNRDEIYYNQPFWGLLVSTILLSVLHTWIYNSTKRSLFAAMLMHTSWNWANYVFTGLLTDTGGLAFLIMLTSSAIAMTIFFGPQTLTSDRAS